MSFGGLLLAGIVSGGPRRRFFRSPARVLPAVGAIVGVRALGYGAAESLWRVEARVDHTLGDHTLQLSPAV